MLTPHAHPPPSLALPLQIAAEGRLGGDGALQLGGHRVALFYFRAGYTPAGVVRCSLCPLLTWAAQSPYPHVACLPRPSSRTGGESPLLSPAAHRSRVCRLPLGDAVGRAAAD